jgi:hypothetical protein
MLSSTILALLPRAFLVPVAMHLFKTLKWWEEYWVDYYLNNGKGYFENVRLIQKNPVCMKTTLPAYEYVYSHPKEFGINQ